MDAALKQLILTRLDGEHTDDPWLWHVLAACEGRVALDQSLGGASLRPTRARGTATAEATAEPPGAYLRSITVEGFRGIGARATLTVPPGPGLTLVVGRNGSGKSSFAEGLEFLLTGRNRRWEDRPTHLRRCAQAPCRSLAGCRTSSPDEVTRDVFKRGKCIGCADWSGGASHTFPVG